MPTSAEARAEAVERLSDGFSHDTRNPLNAMVIHLEVLGDKLRREHGGQIPFGLEKNLKAIRDQVGRIDEMVRRFVELAAPHRQHEPEFELSALLASVVEQCTHQARLARADLRAEALPSARIAGSASELGVAISLFLFAQVEAGAKRVVVRGDVAEGRARVTFDGTVAIEAAAQHELARVAAGLGGALQAHAGHVELSLALGPAAPNLRVIEGTEEQK